MNRCKGYISATKKCRKRINSNDFYCCKEHEPINSDMVEDGCFMCCEKINTTNDILFFKCKHIVHIVCYNKWMDFSTYEIPICMYCRGEINTGQSLASNKSKVRMAHGYSEKYDNILSALK